jgi:hypothetical protein
MTKMLFKRSSIILIHVANILLDHLTQMGTQALQEIPHLLNAAEGGSEFWTEDFLLTALGQLVTVVAAPHVHLTVLHLPTP